MPAIWRRARGDDSVSWQQCNIERFFDEEGRRRGEARPSSLFKAPTSLAATGNAIQTLQACLALEVQQTSEARSRILRQILEYMPIGIVEKDASPTQSLKNVLELVLVKTPQHVEETNEDHIAQAQHVLNKRRESCLVTRSTSPYLHYRLNPSALSCPLPGASSHLLYVCICQQLILRSKK